MHTTPGPGVDGRADHLSYGSHGVTVTLDNHPDCPTGCDGQGWAAGHLSSVASYCYGTYTVSMRTAKASSGPGTKAFTCFGMFSEVSVHNEISGCVPSDDPTKLGLGYWYNANENNQTITLPFDSSEEMHQYGFSWTKDTIVAFVDGKAVWTWKGVTAPSHAMGVRLITRPHDHTTGYDGPYTSQFQDFNGEFTAEGAYGADC